MRSFKPYLPILLIVFVFGCQRLAIEQVPVKDIPAPMFSFHSFYAYKNEKARDDLNFQIFLFGQNGNWAEATSIHEKPLKPLSEVGKRLFYPEEATAGTDLNESVEMPSPDQQWSIKTYSIKTFADDLDNAYLVVRRLQNGEIRKIKVPAQSNGQMWPLFWHPQKPLIYFMVTVGDDKARSLELWEYDNANGIFENIGDTNGDVYLSPDGRWIVWETGLFPEICTLKPSLHCVLLRAYDIEKKVNYRLTEGPSISLFQRWKN